jgi:hypothetical protein
VRPILIFDRFDSGVLNQFAFMALERSAPGLEKRSGAQDRQNLISQQISQQKLNCALHVRSLVSIHSDRTNPAFSERIREAGKERSDFAGALAASAQTLGLMGY